jgi:hypothetical protein
MDEFEKSKSSFAEKTKIHLSPLLQIINMAEFVTRCDVMPQICKRHCMEITKNVAILMDHLRIILTCDFNIQILWSMKCCGTQPLIFRERNV